MTTAELREQLQAWSVEHFRALDTLVRTQKALDAIIAALPDNTCPHCGTEYLVDGDDFLCPDCDGICGEPEPPDKVFGGFVERQSGDCEPEPPGAADVDEFYCKLREPDSELEEIHAWFRKYIPEPPDSEDMERRRRK